MPEGAICPLIGRHRRQIIRLAGRAEQPPFSAQELVEEGKTALWQAAEAYQGDPVEDASGFARYAEGAIRNHFHRLKRDFFRRERAQKRLERKGFSKAEGEAQLDECIREGCDIRELVEDSPAIIEMKREESVILRDAVALLSGPQRAIIEGRYFQGESLRLVGARLDMSAQAAGVYEQRALVKLRSRLPSFT